MIFITNFYDGKKIRLRALPDQTDMFNKKFDQTMNIQGSREIRSKYSLGTVLITDQLLDTGRGFYRAVGVRAASRAEAKEYEGVTVTAPSCEPQELNFFEEF